VKIILVRDDKEPEEIPNVEAFELTVSRLKTPENVAALPGGTVPIQTELGHTSLLGVHDHIRALVMSFDSLKVKCAQAMSAAAEGHDPHYKLLYQKLADFGLARQRELSILDLELSKIERKEAARMQVQQPEESPAEKSVQKEPEDKG
jgi:hypothetical protein